ncbi:hypothetical protein FQZ97_983760 [compost metagenome]
MLQHADHLGRQFLRAGVADAVEQLEVLQLIQLRGDGRLDLLAAVADVDVPQAGHAVHQAIALVVENEATVATQDADGLALLHFVGVQHGVPEGGVLGTHNEFSCRAAVRLCGPFVPQLAGAVLSLPASGVA